MTIVYVLLTLVILLLVLLIILILAKKGESKAFVELGLQLRHLQEETRSVESAVRSEITGNRREAFENDRSARKELAASLAAFEEKLSHLTGTTDAKLAAFNEGAVNQARDTRQEIRTSLEVFRKDFAAQITAFSELQNDLFQRLLAKQSEQNMDTSQKLDKLRDTLEKSMNDMSSANEKKLEQMRQTVDEKLQQTLETRLGESFRLVSERLESVHKGLGDMQQLATGVGDLKRVLNNVKTRGVLGEYQLANLLEQLLTVDQYDRNVKTRLGSNAHVEFAVKMPGRHQTD
ncbi:MAG: DNA recombination protein RmuC, partial [Chitinophagaceae bacterium]